MSQLRFARPPFEAQREALHGIKGTDPFHFDPAPSRAAEDRAIRKAAAS